MDTWERVPKSGALTPATAPANSLSWPARGKLKQAFRDRLLLSEAIDAVGKMVDAYPNGRASITDSYIGNMANLLCQYPRLIALRCADPVRGVTTKTSFIPTVADMVKWCEPLTNDMSKGVGHEDKIATQLRERDEWEQAHPHVYEKAEPGANLKLGDDGRYPVGSILTDFDDAVRLHGRPIGAFEEGREKPYNMRRSTP